MAGVVVLEQPGGGVELGEALDRAQPQVAAPIGEDPVDDLIRQALSLAELLEPRPA
jgi:hypothetical protein